MFEITCRRTRWRKKGTWPPEYVYDRGYYWGSHGPFKSEEAARLHKGEKEIEERANASEAFMEINDLERSTTISALDYLLENMIDFGKFWSDEHKYMGKYSPAEMEALRSFLHKLRVETTT